MILMAQMTITVNFNLQLRIRGKPAGSGSWLFHSWQYWSLLLSKNVCMNFYVLNLWLLYFICGFSGEEPVYEAQWFYLTCSWEMHTSWGLPKELYHADCLIYPVPNLLADWLMARVWSKVSWLWFLWQWSNALTIHQVLQLGSAKMPRRITNVCLTCISYIHLSGL